MISDLLLQDRITILQANGNKYEDIHASVQVPKIFINEVKLPISDGDTIEQTLPSGVVKRYVITDVAVPSGIGEPDHVEITIRNSLANSGCHNCIGMPGRFCAVGRSVGCGEVAIGATDVVTCLT